MLTSAREGNRQRQDRRRRWWGCFPVDSVIPGGSSPRREPGSSSRRSASVERAYQQLPSTLCAGFRRGCARCARGAASAHGDRPADRHDVDGDICGSAH